MLIQPKYDKVSYFSNGFAFVVINKKYSFINRAGEEIVPFKYDKIDFLGKGKVLAILNNNYVYLDTMGKIVIPKYKPDRENLYKKVVQGSSIYPAPADPKTQITNYNGKIPVVSPDLFFRDLRYGRWENISWFIDTLGMKVNGRNTSGYTPLQSLILDYANNSVSQERAMSIVSSDQNIRSYEHYEKCLEILLDKGADPYLKSPEGWNAAQFAVACGKLSVLNKLEKRFKGISDIRDEEGNTLAHLSVFAGDVRTPKNYWKYIANSDNIRAVNIKGQTPLCFYASQPRKKTDNAEKIISALMSYDEIALKDVYGSKD